MNPQAVVVTGMGAVSAFGCGVRPLWQACLDGRSIVAPTPAAWTQYYRATSKVWSPLPTLDFRQHGFSRAELLTMNMPSLLGAIAADEAVQDAGLCDLRPDANADAISVRDSSRRGVFIGTGLGNAKAPFDNYRAHLLSPLRTRLDAWSHADTHDAYLAELSDALNAHPRVNPLVICQTMPNAVAATLGIRYGFHGPNDTVCNACASGTVAIGQAFRAIRRGELDLALAGGVEHLSDRAGGVFMGFDRLQTLARAGVEPGTENRPFDRDRSGFLFSEGGAALLVLESARAAAVRGARVYAEVVGFGQSADARSLVAIAESNNAIRAMLDQALHDAGISKTDIGYINAHGTSTELNDAVEARVIAEYFGTQPKINSTKSILGHTIGASGAFEAVVTVQSLVTQTVHVSRNLSVPVADLNFCTTTSAHTFDYALTQSFGFGGHNAGLVIRRNF